MGSELEFLLSYSKAQVPESLYELVLGEERSIDVWTVPR